MKQTTDYLIGYIGLLACTALSATEALAVWSAGPVIPFIPLPIATLSLWLAALFHQAGDERIHAYGLFLVLYVGLSAVFAVLWWLLTHPQQAKIASLRLLITQVLLALLVDQDWLILTSLALGFFWPQRRTLYAVFAQVVILGLVRIPYIFGWSELIAPLDRVGAFLDLWLSSVWMIVAFGIGYLAATEKHNRLALTSAHAELLATQHLLGETVRNSERLRIARNLHDAIGHHLTALNLHLELALRQANSPVLESLTTSRELAKSLLSEVRFIVSVERQDWLIDLKQALSTLCSGIPYPTIHLDYDEQLHINEAALAHSLFRNIQEAITNTLRHAHASQVWVSLQQQPTQLIVTIQDNGRGNKHNRFGNGLHGIQERMHELGGTLTTHHPSEGGFLLSLQLPLGTRS